MKHLLKSLLCIVLCIGTILVAFPVQAAGPKEYISDIKLVSINDDDPEDREEAMAQLTDAGYKIVYQNWGNLNAGADDGCCYIGYKTTTNPDEAITDIRVMDMNGGYVKSSYDGMTDATRQGFNRMWDGFWQAMNEVRTNYHKGSPAAKYAIEQLDHFTVNSLFGMKLGQAILNDRIKKSDYEDIFYYCSGQTLSVIYNFMLTGCADYGTETWADRAAKISYDQEYDASIYSDAEYFVNSIENTGFKVHKALENFDIWLSEHYTEDQLYDPDIYEEAEKEAIMSLSDEDKFYFMAFQAINVYTVQVADKAIDEYGNFIIDANGDYVMEGVPCDLGSALWGWTDTVRFEPEWCYPIYLGMTEGQRALLPFCGIELFVGSIKNDEATFQELKEASKENGNDDLGDQTLSIFWDVDLTAAKEEVYMTDKAARSLANQGDVAALTKYKERDRTFFDIIQWNSIGFGVLAIFDIGFAFYSYFTGISIGTFAAIGSLWSALTSGASLTFAVGLAGVVGLATVASLIVLVGVALVWLIVKMTEWFAKPSYTTMPDVLYDSKTVEGRRQEIFVRYDLAKAPNGNRADLNAFCSEKWLAVYYSKDKNAGTPILADGNSTFIRREGSSVAPAGYTPMRMFGGRSAVNTNLYTKRDDRGGLFLFYRNEGGAPTYEDDYGPYLRSVKIVHGTDESILRKKIENSEENKIFGQNLTPSDGYTFLTYATTPDPYDAIRDIRVIFGISPRNEDGGFFIGNSPYSNAGAAGNYYFLTSKKVQSGDPIFADSLLATNSPMNLPNYIPVCQAAGGPAANINCSQEFEYDETPKKLFLYFLSDREEETGEVYISGIAELHRAKAYKPINPTRNWEPADALAYAKELGYTGIVGTENQKLYVSFKGVDDVSCYAYSTTTYHKRALGDIMIIDGSRVKQVPQLHHSGTSYMSIPSPVDFTYQGDVVLYWKRSYPDDLNFVGYYNTNLASQCKEIIERTDATGIYVKPADSKDDAILQSHFKFVSYKPTSIADGDTLARDAMSVGKAGRVNDKYYILYNGKSKTQGTYVSGVTVAEVHEDDGTKDDSYTRLINMGTEAYVGGFTMRDGNRPYGDDHYFNVGLTRTDESRKAITDVKIVCYVSGQEVQNEITTANGIRYDLASKDCLCYLDDDERHWMAAYVYTTTNPMAGSPIKKFYFTDEPVMDGSEYVEFEQYVFTMKVYRNGRIADYTVVKDALDSVVNPPYFYFYVSRETFNRYISDIGVVYYTGGNVDSGDYEDIVTSRPTRYHTNAIAKDLNSDAGGKYINLTFKRTGNPDEAITGLLAMIFEDDDDAPYTYTDSKGCLYMQVNGGDCPDLNKGSFGSDYIYLYYTKDPRAGDPMVYIDVIISENGQANLTRGYKWVNKVGTSKRMDFNETAGGDYVYIEYKCESASRKYTIASFFSEVTVGSYIMIGVSTVLVAGAFVHGVIRKRRKERESTSTV